jgi:hypothetical protein
MIELTSSLLLLLLLLLVVVVPTSPARTSISAAKFAAACTPAYAIGFTVSKA